MKRKIMNFNKVQSFLNIVMLIIFHNEIFYNLCQKFKTFLKKIALLRSKFSFIKAVLIEIGLEMNKISKNDKNETMKLNYFFS
jgi:hypothetical protein